MLAKISWKQHFTKEVAKELISIDLTKYFSGESKFFFLPNFAQFDTAVYFGLLQIISSII